MTPATPIHGHESDAERYTAGRMKESEELAFETRMLEKPALAEEVASIQRIREGLRVLSARGELSPPAPRLLLASRPLYALAAVLVLCVIGAAVFGALRVTRTASAPVLANSLTGLRAGVPVTAKLFLTHTRGMQRAAQVPAFRVIELRILPAVAGETDQYRAMLERLADGAVTSDVEVRSDASGYVSLYLDSARVAPGMYRLSLAQGAAREVFLLSLGGEK